MKETYVSVKTKKLNKSEFKNEKFLLPIGGIIFAALFLCVIITPNGRKKIDILKEIVVQTISQVDVKEELIIEEISVNEDKEAIDSRNVEETNAQENILQSDENRENVKEVITEEKEQKEEVISNVVGIQSDKDNDIIKQTDPEEYIIKEGDTLVGICKIKYGTTAKMKEISELNGIENADYIAPGQKIYLP